MSTVGFTVILSSPLREEEAAEVARAIAMIRGVDTVTPGIVDDLTLSHVQHVVRMEVGEKLWSVVFPSGTPNPFQRRT